MNLVVGVMPVRRRDEVLRCGVPLGSNCLDAHYPIAVFQKGLWKTGSMRHVRGCTKLAFWSLILLDVLECIAHQTDLRSCNYHSDAICKCYYWRKSISFGGHLEVRRECTTTVDIIEIQSLYHDVTVPAAKLSILATHLFAWYHAQVDHWIRILGPGKCSGNFIYHLNDETAPELRLTWLLNDHTQAQLLPTTPRVNTL